MRKEKMVTRTMDITNVKAMIVEVDTAQVSVQSYVLVGEYNMDTALKKLKEDEETDSVKIVAINELDHFTQLMGMTEREFYLNAEILPDR